jgi:uncharacterized protein (TIGR03437 family)
MRARLFTSSPCVLVWGTAALFSAALNASAQSPINLSFNNFVVSYVLELPENQYWGSGSVSPFGSANLTATGSTTDSIEIGFPDGDSFHITSTGGSAGANGCTLTGTIDGGSGRLANASGSVSLFYTPCGPDVPAVGSFTLTGTGSMTIPSTGAFTVTPGGLTFSFPQGSSPGSTQQIILNNGTLEAVPYTIAVSGGNWLSVSPSSGSVNSLAISSVAVTVNSTGLKTGTYIGSVIVSAVGKQFVVPVAVLVSSEPEIVLSQTGLQFVAVPGGTSTSPQTIVVLNQGSGSLDFTASASTLSGENWLGLSSTSGSSSALAAGSVTVSVNASGLQPGIYYGKVVFSATGATDSPQTVSVALNVVSPSNSPGAFVEPAGLIFRGSVGGMNPAVQTVTITNPSPDPLSFQVNAFSGGTTSWLTATATSGTVSATQPGPVSIQANLQGLAAGQYIGNLTIIITSPTTTTAAPQTFQIEVVLVVAPQSASASIDSTAKPRATGCTPTQLLPVFTLVGTGFVSTAGWPTPIAVNVTDDCGSPLVSGSVTVTFSSGDPALSLVSIGSGSWTGTWNPVNAVSSVTIAAQAQETEPGLTGSASISGVLQSNPGEPSVSTGGVVSAVSFVPNQPLAPGAFGAIFGSNLSDSPLASKTFPLSIQLGETSVFLAGEQLPLLFAGGGQINAVMPYDVPVNSRQQLLVQKGSAISIPQPVVIAPALPAIITQNGEGTGAALIAVYKADGTALPNNSPVTGGDVIVLYCSGLGAVNPPVAAGSQTPLQPLSKTVAAVTVTIGQQPAAVQFSGLTPLFAQLYQVNVQIPSGLPSGSAVLTMSESGQQSAPVTVIVQ